MSEPSLRSDDVRIGLAMKLAEASYRLRHDRAPSPLPPFVTAPMLDGVRAGLAAQRDTPVKQHDLLIVGAYREQLRWIARNAPDVIEMCPIKTDVAHGGEASDG